MKNVEVTYRDGCYAEGAKSNAYSVTNKMIENKDQEEIGRNLNKKPNHALKLKQIK
ncbi:hypothetical protein [Psychrobacillus sp. OK032]|uniref:hypothetical protein n=1 Tax=Psychrobacillus sp. OK032 TaxID=1884358 RepID=UPI0015A6AD83|nr:hypothetical protein [Psychrobacillus sp. OK032]